MPPVDREGKWKGVITDWAVNTTRKSGYPQLVLTLQATHILLDDNETWQDWAEAAQSITAYVVLMTVGQDGQPKRCLSYEQARLALGWDGVSFASLAAGDWSGLAIQFTTKMDSFAKDNGEVVTSLKVSWINAENAETGLKKLTAEEVSDLDRQFGLVSAKGTPATKAKAQNAQAQAKAQKAKAAPPAQTAPPATTPPPAAPPTEPPAAAPPAPSAVDAVAGPPCSETDGWEKVYKANQGLSDEHRLPDDVLTDYWVQAREELAADTAAVSEVEWGTIRDKVLGHVNIPF